jgi:hypothetical protein
MANVIVSEKSDVVLCSHRGLSPAEIVQDCLEKMKVLLLICTTGFDMSSLSLASQHQYLSLIDDLVELALGHFLVYQEKLDDENE